MSSVIPYAAKVMQARQLFFHEGTLPSGLIDDAVVRSWQRCAQDGRKIAENVVFNPIGRHAINDLHERNRQLLLAAEPAMMRLAETVAGTGYAVLVTDFRGLALAVHGPVERGGRQMRSALRPGVDLSEQVIGTNAMCTAIQEHRPIGIYGAEHFFSQNQVFQCAAAPIIDPFGKVIGSVDITRDSPSPQFGALSLVASCASAIEIALFLQLPAYLTVRLNWSRDGSDQPSAALLSFGPDGEVLAINPAACALIGPRSRSPIRHYGDLFNGSFGDFVSTLSVAQAPVPLQLHSGLSLYLQAVGVRPGHAPKKSLCASLGSAPPAQLHEFGDDRISGDLIRAQRALAAGLPVLITGETGTGKEVAARALHSGGSHSAGSFVAINCAAIPRELIEGELFGHAGGAFTGAKRGGAKGRIEQADGGTLFLDEIGDMPLELQTRLLRVLETREVIRLGESYPRKVDMQLICATHQNLERLVETGCFREDLYYRINGLSMALPALRCRGRIADIVTQLMAEEGLAIERVSKHAQDLLLAYSWPGNVRELRHALRYANAMCEDGGTIAVEHLPERLRRWQGSQEATPANVPAREEALLRDITVKATEAALRASNGNITAAARELGVSRSTLHRWLKKRR